MPSAPRTAIPTDEARMPTLLSARPCAKRSWWSSLLALPSAGEAHAAAHAERHQAPLAAAPAQLEAQRPDEPGAARRQRVADGDGAAVHVQLVVRDAQLPLDRHHLAAEHPPSFPHPQ